MDRRKGNASLIQIIKQIWNYNSFTIGIISLTIMSVGFFPIALGLYLFYLTHNNLLVNIIITLGLIIIWIGLLILMLMYLPKMIIELFKNYE